ncbi:MAG: thioredoxin fold domain-containing protein [Thermodesulfobacteriota bacterium]
MKHPAQVLLALVLVFSAAAALAAEPGWSSFDQGLREGKRSGKYILINFYVDQCRWCQKMFRETYTDSDVAEYLNRNFVPILVHGYREREIADRFEVVGYPTVWFVDPDWEKVAYLPGYASPADFLATLKFINTRAYEEMTFQEFLEREED